MTTLESTLRRALAGSSGRGLRGDRDLYPPGANGTRMTQGRPRQAAVLVPVIAHEKNPCILLTRRADHLPRHAGQVSFPGGTMDPGDDDTLACALREFEEEVGLQAADVTILGRLDGYETVTGFLVTPYVGLLTPPVRPQPDPAEVAEVFELPLALVRDRSRFETRSARHGGVERRFYVLRHETQYIWGATAHMLVNLNELLDRAGPALSVGGDV